MQIGIDIVSISRLESRLTQWPRLAARIFSQAELSYARGRPFPSQHLAARLAAKEAAFKALGCGWPSVSWLDVEVVSEGGRPALRLSGRALAEAGGSLPLLSMSHDADMAVAQVLLLPGS